MCANGETTLLFQSVITVDLHVPFFCIQVISLMASQRWLVVLSLSLLTSRLDTDYLNHQTAVRKCKSITHRGGDSV